MDLLGALAVLVNLYAGMGFVHATTRCAMVPENTPTVGLRCQTSKGVSFERVRVQGKLGWRDHGPGGVIWLDGRLHAIAQLQAQGTCEHGGHAYLPSKTDYEIAIEHKFSEVLKSVQGNNPAGYPQWFWTSTPLRFLWFELGYVFFEPYEKIGYGFSSYHFTNIYALCVQRP